MKIAIASGKGGTGKTTVATNLFLVAKKADLVDCDVEEPNCHLFMSTEMTRMRDVTIPKPIVDAEKCNLCGKCGEFCRYNALFKGKDGIIVFDKLCHGCGGCKLTCPVGAITVEERRIGEIRSGKWNGSRVMDGVLDIAFPSGVPIIKDLKSMMDGDRITLIDCPPGTSCSVVESIRDCDLCILVTEPTPFGAHDLKAAVDVAADLGVPMGVVINRYGIGDDSVERIIEEEGIHLIGTIPNDLEIARVYSDGKMIVEEMPGYQRIFHDILEKAMRMVE